MDHTQLLHRAKVVHSRCPSCTTDTPILRSIATLPLPMWLASSTSLLLCLARLLLESPDRILEMCTLPDAAPAPEHLQHHATRSILGLTRKEHSQDVIQSEVFASYRDLFSSIVMIFLCILVTLVSVLLAFGLLSCCVSSDLLGIFLLNAYANSLQYWTNRMFL